MQRNAITSIKDWISSFEHNRNTGVKYEIKTGIIILLSSKLDTVDNVPEEYKNININSNINSNIKGIVNLTQIDDIGGTGDIGIINDIGETQYYSVTQWTKYLNKCIHNPSPTKMYGLNKVDVTSAKINKESYEMALQYRKKNKGDVPNKKWKRVMNCPGAKNMCNYSSNIGSASWNNFSKDDRLKKLHTILDLKSKTETNTDGIIYYNNTKNRIEYIYKWTLKIDLNNYLYTTNDGIYIYHYETGKDYKNDWIIRTQAKYNNGIIEGISSKLLTIGNPLSSWNSVANINKIFNMVAIEI